MYTTARIAKHPIHPMLVAFPIALYVATVVALIVNAGTHDPFWYRAAFWTNLAGIVMAGVAAVPGVIDLVTLPRSKARRTGILHAAANVSALALFIISCVAIGESWSHAKAFGDYSQLEVAAPLVLGLIGIGCTLVAGWLGWTLVQTHHVGIKPTTLTAKPMVAAEDIDDLDELELPMSTTTPAEPPRYPLHH
ncbi:MAG TPA: DUF2231 domain-containing protein [Kofleriaceae bacterium]|nr:DUF2231 domain-containing protein [Kofleriaceae bacterium]